MASHYSNIPVFLLLEESLSWRKVGHLHMGSTQTWRMIWRYDENWEECCVKASLKGLFSLMKESKLLAGAGCWQINCSLKLDEEVRKILPSLAESVGCSQAQVLSALSLFRSSVFHHWVQQLHKGHRGVKESWDLLSVDHVTKHCWKTPNVPSETGSRRKQHPCCCGLKMPVTVSNTPDDPSDIHSFIMLNEIQDSNVRGPSLCTDNGAKKAIDPLQLLHLDKPVSIDSTLDHFSAYTQGLYKAVFTANLVLSLGQTISDRF
ncbi:hypothetical protein EGW08_001550 [Elysia chlorotica]|uniref:Uncharacterized protein n=1 Tax=Elysia chlorotica TaxID=188477 RepID=A0A433UA10_ELYCH|nr:hypothetical protein EGW08_001550 [Elysia chlorotica]